MIIQTPPQYSSPITFRNSDLNDEVHTFSPGYLQSFSALWKSLEGFWGYQNSGISIGGVDVDAVLNIMPYFVGIYLKLGAINGEISINFSGNKASGILMATNGVDFKAIIIEDNTGTIPSGLDGWSLSGILMQKGQY